MDFLFLFSLLLDTQQRYHHSIIFRTHFVCANLVPVYTMEIHSSKTISVELSKTVTVGKCFSTKINKNKMDMIDLQMDNDTQTVIRTELYRFSDPNNSMWNICLFSNYAIKMIFLNVFRDNPANCFCRDGSCKAVTTFLHNYQNVISYNCLFIWYEAR